MKEALKRALDALEYWDVHGMLHQPTEEAITALRLAIDVQNMASESTYKEALAQQADHSEQHLDMVKAQQEPWCMKMNGCKTKCEDCPVEVAEQEPVAYLCENAVGHKYFRWKKPSSTYKPIPLYTTPPQRTEERNFCPRCGKRTADLTVIHTCTPPKENL